MRICSSFGSWTTEERAVCPVFRFLIRSARLTRSPCGLTNVYSSAQNFWVVAASPFLSASSYWRIAWRISASAFAGVCGCLSAQVKSPDQEQ